MEFSLGLGDFLGLIGIAGTALTVTYVITDAQISASEQRSVAQMQSLVFPLSTNLELLKRDIADSREDFN